MIIDAHTHIFESGHGGPFDLPASADDLVRAMDAAGVDLSIVIPLPEMAGNDFVYQQCRRFPDRLRPIYTPEFDRPEGPLPAMQRFFETAAAVALKIHPRRQRVSVKEERVQEVLSWAAGRRIPVLFDCFPYGETLDDPATHPLAYPPVAAKMPDLQIILAHAGGLRLMEAFLATKTNPNIALEVSLTPVYFRWSSLVQDCAFLCRRVPPGRVIYGSDFPFVRVEDSLAQARDWSAGLDQPVLDELFAGAAQKMYRL